MDIILLHIEISEISIPKIFVMIFCLNVGIMYTNLPTQTWCGSNGKVHFWLSLTNMPHWKTMRVRSRSSPWITSELKDLMHNRDILKIKASKTNDPNDWALFKKQRNIVNKQIRSAKQVYYQNSFNKHTSDSRKTWQTINELTSRKSGKTSVASLKVNGLTITNPLELSNEFNNHFANIGPKLASEINCDNGSYQRYLTVTDKRFKLQPTNPNKVFSLLNKLDKSKATGLDKISARFVRECADLICMPICDIFNQSISQGTFPDDWKYARVTPLYKQGDRGDVNNYRPISVIPIVAKVFEKIVYEQLYAYLEAHDILCQNQSGFRANHSTVTALLEATDSWAYNIDNGENQWSHFSRFEKSFWHCWSSDPSIETKLLWYTWQIFQMVSVILRKPHTKMLCERVAIQ